MSLLDDINTDIGNVFFGGDDTGFDTAVLVIATGQTVQGIFDDPSGLFELKPQARQALAPVRFDFDGPMILLPHADVVAQSITTGSVLVVNGSRFEVVKPAEKDGTGLATVFLTAENVSDTDGSWRL